MWGNIQSVNLSGKITGQFRMTTLSSAIAVQGVGNKVILQAEAQNVRIWYQGTPTTANGFLLTVGTIYEFDLGPEGSIHDLKAIEVAASAVLNVLAVSTK